MVVGGAPTNQKDIKKSSLKNASEQISRNEERRGLNMKLPTGDSQEMGKPQATRIGRETIVRKRCIER